MESDRSRWGGATFTLDNVAMLLEREDEPGNDARYLWAMEWLSYRLSPRRPGYRRWSTSSAAVATAAPAPLDDAVLAAVGLESAGLGKNPRP